MTNAFEELLNIGIALSSVHDLDKLLDMILLEAQRLTSADAGSIYLVEDNKLIFKTTRSNTYFKRWGEKKTREIFKSFELPITKQSIAGYVALTSKPLNISDVGKISGKSEFHYNSTMDKQYGYKAVSMLSVPMLDMNSKIIGVLQLINSMKKRKPVSFTKKHERITAALSSQAAVAILNAKLTEELKSAHLDTIFRLSAAAEYRDRETGNHIKRVSRYSKLIADKINLSKYESELIFWASPMHDIGKLGIPDVILQKPGILTPEEREIMENHTVIGGLILKGAKADILAKSRIIAMTHHEKFDGTGYPQKLKGNAIPIEGRITALADVYDALCSKRCYKDAFPEEKILKILNESRGTHFDPKILDVFLGEYDEVRIINKQFADKEEDFDKFIDVKKINISDLLRDTQ
ncbi:MAG: HD domain-containing protein [Elusimicrobia bacterium]|nr:HD domain-containing protein [Elusimicrobiota bacterium]